MSEKFVPHAVKGVAMSMGGCVPFAKLSSSGARAVDAGAPNIERVDRVVKVLCDAQGLGSSQIDAIVETVDARLERNRQAA